MDAKITKARIGHMLSYDWIKIVAICAVVVVVWVLLFTTLAPRATLGQTFEIYVYSRVSLRSNLGSLDSLHGNNSLSYSALSYDVLDMSQNNLIDGSENTVMSAHFAAGQGDVLFISSYEYDSGEDDENGDPVMTSDLYEYITGYMGYSAWLGGENEYPYGSAQNNPNRQDYLTSCRQYLEQYYTGDIAAASAEQDKQAIEEDFRARIDGDNRYKRESQIQAGLVQEYERIEDLRIAYNNVVGYLSADNKGADGETPTLSIPGLDLTVQSENDENGDGTVDGNDTRQVKGYFSFDLSNVPGLENILTTTRSADETATSQSVNMVIVNPRMQEEALRYEQITFLDYIIKESARLKDLNSGS